MSSRIDSNEKEADNWNDGTRSYLVTPRYIDVLWPKVSKVLLGAAAVASTVVFVLVSPLVSHVESFPLPMDNVNDCRLLLALS